MLLRLFTFMNSLQRNFVCFHSLVPCFVSCLFSLSHEAWLFVLPGDKTINVKKEVKRQMKWEL